MIQPEEDFETWAMIFESVASSPTEFALFLPDFGRLCRSIVETGDLPDPIKDKLTLFHTTVVLRIQNSFKRRSSINEASHDSFIEWTGYLLELGKAGIATANKKLVGLLPRVIGGSPGNVKNEVQKKVAELGIMDAIVEAFGRETRDMGVMLNMYSTFAQCVTVEYAEEKFWEVNNAVIDGLTVIFREELRKTEIQEIREFCDEVVKTVDARDVIPTEFVVKVLDLLSILLGCGMLAQQLVGYTSCTFIISADKWRNAAEEWFRDPEHLEKYMPGDLHEQIVPMLAAVLPTLAKRGFLTDEFLGNLWGNHKMLHAVCLVPFFSMFAQIVVAVPVEQVMGLTEMCMKLEVMSDVQIQFISDFGGALGRRQDSKAAFMIVRNRLFELVTTEGEFKEGTIVHLAAMLQHYLDPETFNDLLQKVTENGFTELTFRLLLGPVAIQPFDSEDRAKEFVVECVSWITSHSEKRDELYGFITSICSKNNVQIPQEKLPDLFALSGQCSFFLTFACSIVKLGLCFSDFVEHFIESSSADCIGSDFLRLVEAFVMKSNGMESISNVCKLPVNKENLLWKFSATKSSESAAFAKVLCNIYANNEPTIITDYEMINTFIGGWMSILNIDGYDKDCLLVLMRCFIERIETNIDSSFFGVRRHSRLHDGTPIELIMRYKDNIQKEMLPNTMTFGSVAHRVSRVFMIPCHKVGIRIAERQPSDKDTLRLYAKGGKDLNIHIYRIPDDVVTLPVRERATIPSTVIPRTQAMEAVLELLRQDHDEAKKLLDNLPTAPSTLFLLEEIYRKRTFSYEQMLPRDCPALFLYNFESLQRAFDDRLCERMQQTGGFKYLIESTSEALITTIIGFLGVAMTKEMSIEYGQLVFDSMLPFLATLMTEEKSTLFKTVSTYMGCVRNYRDKEDRLVLNEKMYDMVEKFMFCPDVVVRESTARIFGFLSIPVHVVMALLPRVGEDQELIFPLVLIRQVNEYDEAVYNMCMERTDVTGFLAILNRMLQLKIMPDDKLEELQNLLISKYICVSGEHHDRKCFMGAVSCLSHMQNDKLLARLRELHEGRENYSEWRIDGDASSISPTGYCGLVNLGATCFLNTALQQFYAIVPLRKKIVEYSGDDEFMMELRNLFTRMAMMKGNSVTTKLLVEKWRGWDGEPINPRTQQDACEFVLVLLDKLEIGLGHDFIFNMFGGTISVRIDGLSVDYHKKRENRFYSFNLDVQRSRNMPSSFEKFQEASFLTGSSQYKAEGFDQKIDAKQVQSIDKLPLCLIIQLNRFEYNYQTGVQRKIDNAFEFPTSIDVAKYMDPDSEKQETKYVLKGIAMHSGTANSGHYTSFVKDRKGTDKWYDFNDQKVTEIAEGRLLEEAQGKTLGRNGYLLFYERVDFEDVDNGEGLEIDDAVRQIIEKECALQNEYRLYCASGYFELMRLLAKSPNIDFVMIAIRYYFDSFPFTTHVSRADEIGGPLVEALENNSSLREQFAAHLLEGPFDCALVFSPQDSVRKYAMKMIFALGDDELPSGFISGMQELITSLLPHWNDMNSYFEVFAHILNDSQDVLNNANDWVDRFCGFLTEDIPKYLEENKNVKPSYFWRGVDLTGLLKTIAILKPKPEFGDHIMTNQSFQLLADSKTTPLAIKQLLSTFDSERVKKFMSDFAVQAGIHVNYFNLLPILFEVLEGDAFGVIGNSRFKIGDSGTTDFDLTCAIASHILDDSAPFKTMLEQNMDLWLFKLLFHEEVDVRLATEHIVGLLVRHQVFVDGIIQFPYHSYAHKFNKIVQTADPVSDVQVARARRFLDFLMKDPSVVVPVVTGKSRAGEYIKLLTMLGAVAGVDVCDFFVTLVDLILPVTEQLAVCVTDIVKHLVTNKCELVTTDFVLRCIPEEIDPKNMLVCQRIVNFYEVIEPIADSFEPPVDFVAHFIDSVGFPSHHKPRKFASIQVFIKKLASMYPDKFRAHVKENFDVIIASHYSALLITLETIGDKMPVLKQLPEAVTASQHFSVDVLVERAFALNDGEVNNVYDIIGLLNIPQVESTSRALIWNLIIEKMPTFDEFKSAYRWIGDWVYLTKYLVKRPLGEAGVLESLRECAKNSMDAFALAYPWLVENGGDILVNAGFVGAVMELDIGEHDDVVREYVNKLTSCDQSRVSDVLKPLLRSVGLRVKFLNGVLDDVKDDGLAPSDIVPLFGPLRVLSGVKEGAASVCSALTELKTKCESEEIVSRMNVPEITTLVNLIREVIE